MSILQYRAECVEAEVAREQRKAKKPRRVSRDIISDGGYGPWNPECVLRAKKLVYKRYLRHCDKLNEMYEVLDALGLNGRPIKWNKRHYEQITKS